MLAGTNLGAWFDEFQRETIPGVEDVQAEWSVRQHYHTVHANAKQLQTTADLDTNTPREREASTEVPAPTEAQQVRSIAAPRTDLGTDLPTLPPL